MHNIPSLSVYLSIIHHLSTILPWNIFQPLGRPLPSPNNCDYWLVMTPRWVHNDGLFVLLKKKEERVRKLTLSFSPLRLCPPESPSYTLKVLLPKKPFS